MQKLQNGDQSTSAEIVEVSRALWNERSEESDRALECMIEDRLSSSRSYTLSTKVYMLMLVS